jgi:hypothetical protein
MISCGREERRLRAIFERAILVALAAGCSTKNASAPSDAGAAATDGPTSAVDAGKDAAKPDDPCAAYVFTPTPPDTCGDYVKFPCGLPTTIVARSDCFFNLTDCAEICPDLHYNCHAADGYCADAGADGGLVVPDDAGAVAIDCAICPNGVGRVPEGLEPLRGPSGPTLLGEYFARAAHLEAASVIAFERLAADLARLGAPAAFVHDANVAADDEARHTTATTELARRFGAAPTAPRVREIGARSLESIATENAVEGCIRETFGALVATWQADHASDPEIARVLRAIAADETRHAALSWAIRGWCDEQLDAAARERVRVRCASALDELVSHDGVDRPELVEAAGLPGREERVLLARSLAASLAA